MESKSTQKLKTISTHDLLYDCKFKHWSNAQKKIVTKIFDKFISDGSLELVFDDGDKKQIIKGSGKPHFTIRPPSFWILLKIFYRPSYYPLQSYVEREWTCINCDLADFISFLGSQQQSVFNGISKFMRHLPSFSFLFKQYVTRVKSTRKTYLHYDVPAKFYQDLLEPINIYSCAFFENDNENLKQAQMRKLNTIMTRLGLNKNSKAKILDIGCGWGETIFRLAENYPNIKFSGISISANQINYANQKLTTKKINLKNRIDLELCDYRLYDTHGDASFDNIISVGMLEHVGKTGYYDFFSNVRRLLKPGGKALIHTITSRTQGATHQWIDKHIFPGGYIPRASEVLNGIERSGLKPLDAFHHDGMNYYKTLQFWKENLTQKYEKMLPLLHKEIEPEDEKDILICNFRRWYTYLCASQSFFIPIVGEGSITHFLIEKDQ